MAPDILVDISWVLVILILPVGFFAVGAVLAEEERIGAIRLPPKIHKPVAAVIFIASVVVPLGKLVALILLCWSVGRGKPESVRERTVAYRVTEFVGRWSMIDVFVVAILVSLIQLEGLLSIHPGTAALAFCGVVVVTILAAESFDPRLMWDRVRVGREPRVSTSTAVSLGDANG